MLMLKLYANMRAGHCVNCQKSFTGLKINVVNTPIEPVKCLMHSTLLEGPPNGYHALNTTLNCRFLLLFPKRTPEKERTSWIASLEKFLQTFGAFILFYFTCERGIITVYSIFHVSPSLSFRINQHVVVTIMARPIVDVLVRLRLEL